MNTEDWGLSAQDTARLRRELKEGEQVVLVAKPRSQMSLLDTLFHLLPGVFLLGTLSYVVCSMREIWWLVGLISLPFWVLGVCLLYSPRHHKRKRERTLYVLTDKRVVVLEPKWPVGERVVAYPLRPNPVKAVYWNKNDSSGCGDIVFAYEQRWQLNPRVHRGPAPVGFIDVPQVERVDKMIAEQVAAVSAATPLPPAVPPSLGSLPTETDSWGNATPQQMNKGVLVAMGIAFSLFSLIFIALGVYLMRQDARLDDEGVRTEATVVRVNVSHHTTSSSRHHTGSGVTVRVGSGRNRRESCTYFPVLQFTDAAGVVHEYESTTGSSSYNYPVGHRLPITYLPSDPSRVRLEDGGVGLGLIFTLAGSFALLIGGAILAGGLVMKKQ